MHIYDESSILEWDFSPYISDQLKNVAGMIYGYKKQDDEPSVLLCYSSKNKANKSILIIAQRKYMAGEG